MFIEIVYAAEEATREGASNPIATLGINLKLFIAQLINFLIVLLVLWKWVYTPLVKKMNERTGKIEKGLRDARTAAERLQNTEAETARLMSETKRKAHAIVAEAKKAAEEQRVRLAEESKQRADGIVAQAKAEIEQEKRKMIQEAKKEVGGVVIAVAEKILGKVVDEKIDKRLVEETLQEFRSKQ